MRGPAHAEAVSGSPLEGTRVAVVGAGVAGLLSALAFARRGADVVILDRDAGALEVSHHDSPAGDAPFGEEWRKGTPQARHTHACAALGRRVLREHVPDLWESLLAAGAIEMPFGGRLLQDGATPRHDDAELFGLAVRRSLFESILRDVALSERRIQVRPSGAVTGLIGAPNGIPVVEGVRTAHGDVRADLTIDALGRASHFGTWLEGLGSPGPQGAAESCGLAYLTRWYRLARRPGIRLNAGFSAGGYGAASGCIACPADNGYLSVTLMVPQGDALQHALLDEAAFTAAAGLHPGMSPWLEPGVCVPLSPVLRWPGCENHYRRYVVDGRPVALGVIGAGDAVCATNPTYTRGMSLAARHAFAVADMVCAQGTGDLYRLAMGADAIGEAVLRPWFEDSVAQDRVRNAQWAGVAGHSRPGDGPTLQQLTAAAAHDDVVWHALARRSGMLDAPDAVFTRADVLDRARRALAQRPSGPQAGPSRNDLLALVARRPGAPAQATSWGGVS
ncbi:NAD(P)/FAD-dependent oxidoreductase [Paracidovorax cattleyae]|uniref:NAD(P)/FAD-dependent oxidoreductase n=1 Tax=Paracidovorax cattleyae TaxID=80868 RepID=UPI001E284F9E|nr:FAD-dependent oxidoreductase [Paracidovorax cattleyae]